MKKYIEVGIAAFSLFLIFFTLTGVVFRYALHHSLSFQEELSKVIHLWLVTLTGILIFKEDAHFRVRFLLDKITQNSQLRKKIMNGILLGITVAFCLALLRYGVTQVVRSYAIHSKTIALSIPYWILYSSLPILGGGILIVSIREIVNLIRRRG